MRRWKAWLGSAAMLLLSAGVAAYAGLAFAVTASTGTVSADQRAFFELLLAGALAGTLGAAVLLALGRVRPARTGH